MFATIVAAALIAAASPTPSPSPTPVPEIGRVTTSDRRSEPIGDTSRPTFVVDRAQIEAFGARTVADALATVPGVNVFNYGPFGAQVDYGIRGALPTQTLLLVDGEPIADPTTGTVLIGQLSTIGVQRIEIVESGNSTLYGTNASGGVINIITSVPRGTYLLGSTGSFGDRVVRLALGNGTIGASFERHVSIGDYPYPTFAYAPTATFPGAVRFNTFGQQSAGRIGFDGGSAPWRVRARLDLSATYIGIPGRLDFLTPNATQATADSNGLVELEHPSGASTWSLTIGGSNHRLAFNDPSNGGESDTYAGRAQVSLKDVVTAGRFDLVTGIDLARESGIFAESGTPTIGAAQSQAAAYAQLGYSPYPHARIVGGLRAENDGPQGSVVDPSFGGVLQLGKVRLAGNVAETFRVPTLQDLYFPGFANPSLVPERAQASDITFATQLRSVQVSVGWFARSGSNFIVFDPVQNMPINEQRAQTAGLAATANVPLPGGLLLGAGVTDLYRSLDLVTGARLPRSPVGQAIFTLSHPFAHGNLAYGLRWAAIGSGGDDKANVPPPLSNTYDAYATLDAYVRFKLAPAAVVTVRGFNLTNGQYAPIYGYPALGRSWNVEFATR